MLIYLNDFMIKKGRFASSLIRFVSFGGADVFLDTPPYAASPSRILRPSIVS